MPLNDENRNWRTSAGLASAGVVMSASGASDARRTSMGLVTYSLTGQGQRGRIPELPDYTDPLVFISEAAKFGASAVQFPFGVRDAEGIKLIQQTAQRLAVTLEGTLSLPRKDSDAPRFESEIQTLNDLGVRVARTVIFPGRRYEDLKTIEAYEAALSNARDAIKRAEPIAKKHQIVLAIENHKDQRVEERLALLTEFNSEYIGACLDVGNNISLLEDPVEVCGALAAWARTVHFKDQGVREYEDGFLLADVPLGRGCIDLPGVIQAIRDKAPKARFQLELITRDALKVPVLTEQYWATFPDAKASQLARAWAMIKQRSSSDPFPVISALSPTERIQAERANLEESFRYAADHLGFAL
ncbi:MAG TPA: TIM barrel protein [Verrucomicrobiae bacterium]|jgi:sugar phosphate isomerase/epimerase|nr:TIM barrel protein [Verrucomicrobiae bacterium]